MRHWLDEHEVLLRAVYRVAVLAAILMGVHAVSKLPQSAPDLRGLERDVDAIQRDVDKIRAKALDELPRVPVCHDVMLPGRGTIAVCK